MSLVELLFLKLSLVTDLTPQTSLGSENIDPHRVSECLAINRRSIQGDKVNPLDSLFSNIIPQGPRPISLLHIPPEVMTRILLYLSPHDIISCGRTCHTDFRWSVQVSVPFHATGTYDLRGGAFLLGTKPFCADHLSTVGYSYVSLPSLSKWRGEGLTSGYR